MGLYMPHLGLIRGGEIPAFDFDYLSYGFSNSDRSNYTFTSRNFGQYNTTLVAMMFSDETATMSNVTSVEHTASGQTATLLNADGGTRVTTAGSDPRVRIGLWRFTGVRGTSNLYINLNNTVRNMYCALFDVQSYGGIGSTDEDSDSSTTSDTTVNTSLNITASNSAIIGFQMVGGGNGIESVPSVTNLTTVYYTPTLHDVGHFRIAYNFPADGLHRLDSTSSKTDGMGYAKLFEIEGIVGS